MAIGVLFSLLGSLEYGVEVKSDNWSFIYFYCDRLQSY